MSRLITRNNLSEFVTDGCLILEKGMLLSPGADDLAKIQGIQVIRSNQLESTALLKKRIHQLLIDVFNVTNTQHIERVQQAVLKHLVK
ncbi:hypothetical protein [Endozoicomonas ascidiicola]|uniref:hypothetical protein n=1 Tax=Endozoicomonas ascidiicola TaxID=1698521 RepID=UPI0008373D38|nr:hypothetical protein [Endozoicomonas ascidiicola]